jgi:hypothetical protein
MLMAGKHRRLVVEAEPVTAVVGLHDIGATHSVSSE